MKLRSIKEVVVQDAIITIHINPIDQKTTLSLRYTCPHCDGYGCGRHGSHRENKECNNGSITRSLDPSKLDQVFEPEQLINVKAALQNLYLEVTGNLK